MVRGRIRFFHDRKSFGFIEREEDPDVFFHISDFEGDLPEEGLEVDFEIRYGGRGPRGVNVTPLYRNGRPEPETMG